MRTSSKLRQAPVTAALLTLASASAGAQTLNLASAGPAAAARAPSAGLFNDWLREQDPLFNPIDLGGQFRARFVYQTYFAIPGAGPSAVDFRADTPHSVNDFLLLRTRFHAGWSPVNWLTVYGEGQNSSSTGDKRNPNSQSDGPVDLRQAYLRLGGLKELPLSLKVGRQELAYADERLVGVSDWDNITRVFDAVKLRYEQSTFWVDAFTGRVVLPNDNEFDQANWDDWFSGIYGSSRSLVPKTELQLYFLADNASSGSPAMVTTATRGNTPRDIYTIGARFQTLPGQLHGWDFNGEFAGQFGNFQYTAATPGVVTGERLNHLAYATHIEGGYTFTTVDLKPRLALGFDYGSGDHNPNDQSHNTFVNLYPTNHKFYGSMDFFSWQNVVDPYLRGRIVPVKDLSVTLTYHVLWLATTSDFFYQINQSPRTTGGYGLHPQNSSFAGQEVDLMAAYQPTPFLQIQLGFSHYFAGSYVNQTLENSGGAHDANWVYLQAQVSL